MRVALALHFATPICKVLCSAPCGPEKIGNDQKCKKKKLGELGALPLYLQVSVLAVEIQGATIDYMIAHYHTVRKCRLDSHQVECNGPGF